MSDPVPSARAVIVLNPGDDVAAVRRLDALGGPGRLVVRPTPGGSGYDLALDVLAATGKSPARLIEDKPPVAVAFRQAAAWLTAAHVTDVLVDRAHRLTPSAIKALAGIARTTGATLWLIHATDPGDHPEKRLRTLAEAGCQATAVTFEDFCTSLPLPAPAITAPRNRDADLPWPIEQWPELPLADFPLFLATCRRQLPGDLYSAVRFLLDQEVDATTGWIERQTRRPRALEPGRLVARLRDHRLGPAPDPATALIRLRAAQIALLLRGHHLRWAPARLGPDPAARLTTRLTTKVAAALHVSGDTAGAAATVLALHFSTGTYGFGLIQCGHVPADGRHLHMPPPEDPERNIRPPWLPEQRNIFDGIAEHMSPAQFAYLFGTEPIPVPPAAAPILAAHLAYRRAEGAGDSDPYFVHPKTPGVHNPERGLREAVLRNCHRLHLSPAWLHRGHCRHGDGLLDGHLPGHLAWTEARALTYSRLDRQRWAPR